jgi:PAS domain S-box-containing protein
MDTRPPPTLANTASSPDRPPLFGRWWRRQSPLHQDRYATLAPLAAVLLFLAAIISAFWYLRNEEFEREGEAVRRDTELAQQHIRLRMIENEESLGRIAQDLVTRSTERATFMRSAADLIREQPEINRIYWFAANRAIVATQSANGYRTDNESDAVVAQHGTSMPKEGSSTAAELAFVSARAARNAVYSRAFADNSGVNVIQVHVPMMVRNVFLGMIVAEYSTDNLLRFLVPPDVSSRHALRLTDSQNRILASTVLQMPGRKAARSPSTIEHEVPALPSGDSLRLHGEGYRTSAGLIGNTLFWMVVALSILTVWMLLGTWRHVRRRSQMQSALVAEANFRRAMENSMLTGMRAMDMEGRITYVNPAFCAMTGFSESELIGRRPPFPYWPPDRHEEIHRLLQQELQGRSPTGGIEVKVMHKGGELFDSRMYVSPLVDPRGLQTGWMTSMTNITEAKRVRDQLSASHERFTTVLEGLDAAVSVLSVQQGELLFANRSYRLWFGADALGHALLAGDSIDASAHSDSEDIVEALGGLPTQELTRVGSDAREVLIEPLNKWFDVRARYLQWTDGRLAQMLIATDVTARRNAETLAANQSEKAQVTSRLVTMGEMASSVAHELNQPLTAIANYCNGILSRVRDGAIEKDDLIVALEKTSRQAQRAGQIIHRIRAFVKRSEPQRQSTHAATIVEDALELASIELKRRKVAIHTYVAERLPVVMVDPILIEQVLLNLLKNAAEAIDTAQLPTSRRSIELRVVPKSTPEEGEVIEFSVTDMGPGIRPEVLARLYEAFFSTKAEGLGIGLSLCRSIVESHRGRIRADNLYNGNSVTGCRFAFTLPVQSDRVAVSSTPNPALTT